MVNGGAVITILSGLALAFITGGVILYGNVSAHDTVLDEHGRRLDNSDIVIRSVENDVERIGNTIARIETRQVTILESVERIENRLGGSN